MCEYEAVWCDSLIHGLSNCITKWLSYFCCCCCCCCCYCWCCCCCWFFFKNVKTFITLFHDHLLKLTFLFFQADLEGIPEITLNISSSCLDFLVVHPCVLEGDTHVQIPSFQPSQMLKGPELVGRKVRFRPPTESFHLCHYSSKTPYGLPVRGIYQMQVRGRWRFGRQFCCIRIYGRQALLQGHKLEHKADVCLYLVVTVCKGSVH